MTPPQKKHWRILRRLLIGGAVLLTLIGLFYTEEDWRGARAWDDCKRSLEAQGVKTDWAVYIPPTVPEDQNVFGVPEMQKWFVGRGVTELSKKMVYPAYPAGRDPGDPEYPNSNRTARLTVAEVTIVLPGADIPDPVGATIVRWGDEGTKDEVSKLIENVLGPVVMAPVGYILTLRSPQEIRPAQILLQCQTAPPPLQLRGILPDPIANTDLPNSEEVKVEPTGANSYKMTMAAPDTVGQFLNWSEQIKPQLALIRQALGRPYTRMHGNYENPIEIPIPNFVTLRSISQMLATMAQCHLVEGKPEEALSDLTLIHDLCRNLEGSRPMTLVAAMINVAVTGLYADTIARGLGWGDWRDPQLAALTEQLKQINLLSPVKEALEMEWVFGISETQPAEVQKILNALNGRPDEKTSIAARLIPSGWCLQNTVAIVTASSESDGTLDADRQLVFPDKATAAIQNMQTMFSHRSPYTFIAAQLIPNYNRALKTCAHNQTFANQTLIACALERYRQAHGEYPENLDALVPQFIAAIPHDLVGGQPPHYRRMADGTFILYSIGWNGRDNGGARDKTDADGDWVWPVDSHGKFWRHNF